jgi:hypothetical protein
MRRATTSAVLALALTALTILPAMAATVVVPNINTVTPGPSNQAFPFNQGDMRYQQVFAANQLGGLVGPVTKIAYRVDEQFANPFTSNAIDCEIRLCHTTAAPTAMSLTFANNLGGDVTLVYDGFLNLSSAGNPALFDIILDINDNFAYNGSSNLLVDVKIFGPAITGQFDAAGTGIGQGGTPWTDRVWAIGVNSLVGSSDGDDGMVTQLTIEGATAVEPTTWGKIKANFEGR